MTKEQYAARMEAQLQAARAAGEDGLVDALEEAMAEKLSNWDNLSVQQSLPPIMENQPGPALVKPKRKKHAVQPTEPVPLAPPITVAQPRTKPPRYIKLNVTRYHLPFSRVSDEQAGQIIKAVLAYADTGEVPALQGIIREGFQHIRDDIDAERGKQDGIRQARSLAGRKGMATRWGGTVEE
jgi:hypothetical protein